MVLRIFVHLINTFWAIVNNLCLQFHIPALIQSVHSGFSQFATYTTYLSGIIAKVYFFIPRNVVLPLVLLVFGLVGLRILLAIVNLIWW